MAKAMTLWNPWGTQLLCETGTICRSSGYGCDRMHSGRMAIADLNSFGEVYQQVRWHSQEYGKRPNEHALRL